MATEQKKRIINLAEKSAPENGDFFAVDSQAGGTKKIPTTALAKAADLTAEAAARTQADNALTSAINSASALIQNPTKTVSGALCSFTDGANMPMVACTASIVPKQSGTGTPSPDNVRQISGWESVTIADYAVNMLTEQTNEKRPCYIKAGTSIVASVKKNGDGNAYFYYYRADGSQIDYWSLSSTQDGRSFRVINIQEDVYFVAWLAVADTTITDRQVAITPRLEYSETLATTITKDLGRTVYGGALDVVSGVLTVDRAMVDLGTLNWTKSGTRFYKEFSASSPERPYAQPESFAYVTDALCSQYTATSRANIESVTSGFSIHASGGSTYVTVHDEQYDNVDTAAFKTAMSGVQLVYELATPQTYQLTPTEVNTLLGENNVWADSGDVAITYRRDISIVLENLENAINGSNSLNTMMMSAPTENTAEEPTEDEAENDMR